MRNLSRVAAIGVGLSAAAYGASAARTWYRYGRRRIGPDGDRLLDRFLPEYHVVESHHTRVYAPADVTLAAAKELDLTGSPVVRALFKGRELFLGGAPEEERVPEPLLPAMQAIGWVVLEEIPGRELVFGAVTRPWEAHPVFRSVPAADFAAFNDPGYVKIAWTLCADPEGPNASIFHTETRAIATDASARAKFRCYWSLVEPGVVLIRRALLRGVRRTAERRACAALDLQFAEQDFEIG